MDSTKDQLFGDFSDGYHTFNELYEHRNLLFLAFCLTESGSRGLLHGQVYWQQDHFPDWDLVSTKIGGKQISYHLPSKYRHILEGNFEQSTTLEEVFDGHTSKDVIERLISAIEAQ